MRPARRSSEDHRIAQTQAAADRQIARLQQTVDLYDDGIEALLRQHRPSAHEDDLRPGNSREEVRFWCTECRQAWPCRPFNSLREVYGKAHDWDAAQCAYEPLVLVRQPESTTARSAPGAGA